MVTKPKVTIGCTSSSEGQDDDNKEQPTTRSLNNITKIYIFLVRVEYLYVSIIIVQRLFNPVRIQKDQ